MTNEKGKQPESAWAGCIALPMLLGLLYMCSGSDEPPTPEQVAAAEVEQADNRRKGFHCLSAWDGSNSEFVELVKQRLRDPASFEHIDTLVTPVDAQGEHTITMQYRARNGFGGMNVETAIGTVRQSTCSAKIAKIGA